MKNLSRLQSVMDEIVQNLRIADDWRASDAYSRELLAEAADACVQIEDVAIALRNEIKKELEDNQ